MIEMGISVLSVYLMIGGLFTLLFLAMGMRSTDPDAAECGVLFKGVIIPGLIFLWPIMLGRWVRA